MKLIKPGWIHLDGRQIFSIDIDPRGRYLAIAGQGENNCGVIVIYNFDHFAQFCPNVNSAVLGNVENLPKKLFELSNHLGCVNCVRWSPDGRFLASGSDDRLVMIWQLVATKSAPTNASYTRKYPDQGRCVAMLREHIGDVLDLAWSSNAQMLASCSIDNTIVVWNAAKFPVVEKLATLKKHTGLVKGVCFDPAGVYLASQSDDKSLIVWRTSDWSVETKITEPYKECNGATHILRLSWAPDGQSIVTAHAMNGGGPTAQLVSRGPPWLAQLDLAGHRRAVTCTRFNNRQLSRVAEQPLQSSQNGAFTEAEKMPDTYCAVAIGSRDRSVSIWLTHLSRPRMVLSDVFSDSVVDLSWFQHCLFACSVDGTVACMVFTDQEIGKIVSEKETASALKNACLGKDQKRSDNVIITSAAMMAERKKLKTEHDPGNGVKTNNADSTVKQLLSDGESKPQAQMLPPAQQSTSNNNIRPSSFTPSSPFPTASSLPAMSNSEIRAKCMSPQSSKQVEIKLPNGKRRITPMAIAIEPLSPNGLSLFDTASTAGDLFAKPQPISVNNIGTPNSQGAPFVPNSESTKNAAPPVSENPPQTAAQSTPSTTGEVVKVTAGRFVAPKVSEDSAKPVKLGGVKRPLPTSSSVPSVHKKANRQSQVKSSAPRKVNRIESSSSENEDESGSDEESSENQRQAQTITQSHSLPKSIQISSLLPAKLPVHGRNSKTAPSSLSYPLSRDDLKQHTISVYPMEDRNGAWILECSLTPVISSASTKPKKCWIQVIQSPCIAFTVSKKIVAVADNSGRISIFSLKAGTRLAGPYAMPSNVAFLESRDWKCLAVTMCGTLQTWEVKPTAAPTCLFLTSSLPRLRDGDRFRSCFLAECGAPIVVAFSSRSFIYSIQQMTWLEMSESLSQNLRGDTECSISNALVAAKLPNKLNNGSADVQRAALKDALACNLLLAQETQSVEDYRTAVMAYFRFLVREENSIVHETTISFEPEIRDLFNSLLFSSPNSNSFISKKIRLDVVRDLLGCLASNLRYENLFVEIESQLVSQTSQISNNNNGAESMNCN